MDIEEYIIQLKETRDKLVEKEEFEICAEINNLIRFIEEKNLKAFIKMNFDLKVLKQIGYIKNTKDYAEIEERIKFTFSLDSIYDYVIREEMWCPFYRYLNEMYDSIKKVEF